MNFKHICRPFARILHHHDALTDCLLLKQAVS